MATINVRVTMQNGSGMGVFVKVDDKTLFFDKSGSQDINLSPQFYSATIGGHEPSTSIVTIQFLQDENVKGEQSYATPTFFGFIPFTVD